MTDTPKMPQDLGPGSPPLPTDVSQHPAPGVDTDLRPIGARDPQRPAARGSLLRRSTGKIRKFVAAARSTGEDDAAARDQAAAALIRASDLFDERWYLGRNPDVAATSDDPAMHYLLYGGFEGRDPSPDFSSSDYCTLNPDVAESRTNPLLHYISFGQAEGRATKPEPDPGTTSAAAAHEAVIRYRRWVAENDVLDDLDRRAIRHHVGQLAAHPVISVVVPLYNTDERHLRSMIASVIGQLYPYWELCLADDASSAPHVERVARGYADLDPRIKFVRREVNGHISAATNSALALASGAFVALVDHDDLIPEHALYEIAVEINAHPDADILYSDSDLVDENEERHDPYFKPDWDYDLMLGHNMVSHLGVYRRSIVEEIGGLRVGYEGSQDYDLMLRALDASASKVVRHIPAVLYHWRRKSGQPTFSEHSLERCVVSARRAIRDHLRRRGVSAQIKAAPMAPAWTRIEYPLPARTPLVSIIIPTRDGGKILARCVDGLLTRTDYEPVEIIIVDNDSESSQTRALLDRLSTDERVRVIPYPGDFNFSAINNTAVREAQGEILLFLNDDIDVISGFWLSEMISQALRPEIGAVGAKLIYPDNIIQHAGVLLGVGHGAGHYFHRHLRGDVGYTGFLALARQVSAVTAACLAIRREVFEDIGGFDEAFPIAFNDVDLCLRVRDRGLAILWTPSAELYHHESATRGSDLTPDRVERLENDAKRLKARWGPVIEFDPFYNPNCSLVTASYEPGFPSRRMKPWLGARDALLVSDHAPPAPEPIQASPYTKSFERRLPSAQTAIDIFHGRWACDLHPVLGVEGTGGSRLFDEDTRPAIFANAFGREGSLSGMKILELGPLEGAHTYQLQRLGADSIVAIESNVEAFLKCLVVKETLGLTRAQFLLGDAVDYLANNTEPFDAIFASGILYHMADPLGFIDKICRRTSRCFIWTHYYSPDHALKDFKPREVRQGGMSATYWSHDYGDVAHLGGNAPQASWLDREAILGAFRYFGLDRIDVTADQLDHPHGPCFSFTASRSGA